MLTKRFKDLHSYTQDTVINVKEKSQLVEYEKNKLKLIKEFIKSSEKKGFNIELNDILIDIYTNVDTLLIHDVSFTGKINTDKCLKFFKEDINFNKNYKDNALIIQGKILEILPGKNYGKSAHYNSVGIDFSIYKISKDLIEFFNNKRIELCEELKIKLEELYNKYLDIDNIRNLLEEENNWWTMDGTKEFINKPIQYDYSITFSDEINLKIKNNLINKENIGDIASFMMKKNYILNELEEMNIDNISKIKLLEKELNNYEEKVLNILNNKSKRMWWLDNPKCKCSIFDNLESNEYIYSDRCEIHKELKEKK